MKTALVFLVISFYCTSPIAQGYANIWYFGENTGLDFSTGEPVPVFDGIVPLIGGTAAHSEGTAVLCNEAGQLLMYCSHTTVYNKLHQPMQNGTGLTTSISSSQAALFIPWPSAPERFLLFTTDAFWENDLAGGLRYSIIDICQDNGNGAILENQKDILLLDYSAEKLCGVRHANGTDYWIITLKFNTNNYYAYPITSAGIGAPIISAVGSTHQPVGSSLGAAGGPIKASPNGQRLVSVNFNASPAIAELFDFNTQTGVISNPINLQSNPNYQHVGASFSPDNSKLYLAGSLNSNGIFQYDLNAGSPSQILNSRTQVAHPNANWFSLQLGPNSKIYATRSPFGSNPFVSVIHNPNATAANCQFADQDISLNGHTASYGFPNFIDSFQYTHGNYDCSSDIHEQPAQHIVTISPNPAQHQVTISCTAGTALTQIRILDGRAQILHTTFPTSNQVTIDLTPHKPGLHFLQYLHQGHWHTTKLVIQ